MCSLYFALTPNNQVLQSSKVKIPVTTHFFVFLQCLSSKHLSIFLYESIPALNATNSVMNFFTKINMHNLLIFSVGIVLLSIFKYLIVCACTLIYMFCNVFVKIFCLFVIHKADCVNCNIALFYFHALGYLQLKWNSLFSYAILSFRFQVLVLVFPTFHFCSLCQKLQLIMFSVQLFQILYIDF